MLRGLCCVKSCSQRSSSRRAGTRRVVTRTRGTKLKTPLFLSREVVSSLRRTSMLHVATFSLLLASATALHLSTVRTRRVCITRARPAIARLGEPHGNNDLLRELDATKPGNNDLLRELDATTPTLSYGGWQQDAAEVEDGLVRCGPSVASRMLAKMRRKQRLHEGDRSDVVLQVLDDVKQGLTYDGWEVDVGRVERDWTGGWDTEIQEVAEKMRRKQLEYVFGKLSTGSE